MTPLPTDMTSSLLGAADRPGSRPLQIDQLLASPKSHVPALRWLGFWHLLTGELDEVASVADRIRRLAPAATSPSAFLKAVELAEKIERPQLQALVRATLEGGEACIELRLLIGLLLAGGRAKAALALLPSLGREPPAIAAELILRTLAAAGVAAYGTVGADARGRVAGWFISRAVSRGRPKLVVRRADGTRIVASTTGDWTPVPDAPFERYDFALDGASLAGEKVQVIAAGKAGEASLSGSPLAIPHTVATAPEGEVWSVRRGVVKGWARHPSFGQQVRVLVRDDQGNSVRVRADLSDPARAGDAPDDGVRAFVAVLPASARPRRIEVLFEDDGRPFAGSPFADPDAAHLPWLAAQPPRLGTDPVAPGLRARALGRAGTSRVIDVIVPAYRNREETLACIASVLDGRGRQRFELVVVDDASPEPRLPAALDALAAEGRIHLVRNDTNLGFVGSVNRAMALHPDRDAVILNADTLVAAGWLDRLAAAASSDPEIGTATPLSNNATICSYPTIDRSNPMPSPAELRAIDGACAALGPGAVVDVPTGVGFCMFVRRACWKDVGELDASLFGRGYGEENDFCLRARDRGWRNVAVGNVFVAHQGGTSFGDDSHNAIGRAGRLLNAIYPGYDRFIAAWIKENPLRRARRAVDMVRLAGKGGRRVLMISADVVGGIARHLHDLAGALAEDGIETLVLKPRPSPVEGERELALTVASNREGAFPNLVYRGEGEWTEMIEDLRKLGIESVHIHHLLGLPDAVAELPSLLGCPLDVTVHDYSWICKRINLIDESGAYCGEPAVDACDTCVRINGATDRSPIGTRALRERSARIFAAARSVLVPSLDAKDRMSRYFPDIRFVARFHEKDALKPRRLPSRAVDEVRVAVVGAIGPHKGYDVLMECARDAARRSLPLAFRVIGYTRDDAALLRTGRVWVTGPFTEDDVDGLIARERCDAAFLPSVWPETWCYALTPILRAGITPVVFDVGAMPERLRRLGAGEILPLGLPPAAINDRLLAAVGRRGRIEPAKREGRRVPGGAAAEQGARVA